MGRDLDATRRGRSKVDRPDPLADHELAQIDPGHWKPGLGFGMKPLNTKSVKRARLPEDVLRVCAEHNLRSGNEAHRHRSLIDAGRTPLNEVLAGAVTPDGVAEEAWRLYGSSTNRAKTRPRKDLIMGIEFVFQVPPEWDRPEVWASMLDHLRQAGFERILHAVVHRDQGQPHIHVIVAPIKDGKWVGAELTQGPLGWKGRRAEFNAHMRKTFGLRLDRDVATPGGRSGIEVDGHRGLPQEVPPDRPSSMPGDLILGACAEPTLPRFVDALTGVVREPRTATPSRMPAGGPSLARVRALFDRLAEDVPVLQFRRDQATRPAPRLTSAVPAVSDAPAAAANKDLLHVRRSGHTNTRRPWILPSNFRSAAANLETEEA